MEVKCEPRLREQKWKSNRVFLRFEWADQVFAQQLEYDKPKDGLTGETHPSTFLNRTMVGEGAEKGARGRGRAGGGGAGSTTDRNLNNYFGI